MTDIEQFDKVYSLVFEYFINSGITYFRPIIDVGYYDKKDMISRAKTYTKRNADYLKYAEDNNSSYEKDFVSTYTIYQNGSETDQVRIMVKPYRDFKFFLIFEIIKYNYINDKELILKYLSSYEKQNKENFEKKTDKKFIMARAKAKLKLLALKF